MTGISAKEYIKLKLKHAIKNLHPQKVSLNSCIVDFPSIVVIRTLVLSCNPLEPVLLNFSPDFFESESGFS